jgi:hypothetical protein
MKKISNSFVVVSTSFPYCKTKIKVQMKRLQKGKTYGMADNNILTPDIFSNHDQVKITSQKLSPQYPNLKSQPNNPHPYHRLF